MNHEYAEGADDVLDMAEAFVPADGPWQAIIGAGYDPHPLVTPQQGPAGLQLLGTATLRAHRVRERTTALMLGTGPEDAVVFGRTAHDAIEDVQLWVRGLDDAQEPERAEEVAQWLLRAWVTRVPHGAVLMAQECEARQVALEALQARVGDAVARGQFGTTRHANLSAAFDRATQALLLAQRGSQVLPA